VSYNIHKTGLLKQNTMIGNILRGFGETYLAQNLDILVTPKPIRIVKRLKPTEIDRNTIRLFEQEAQISSETELITQCHCVSVA
jgi:hypothetical protein